MLHQTLRFTRGSGLFVVLVGLLGGALAGCSSRNDGGGSSSEPRDAAAPTDAGDPPASELDAGDATGADAGSAETDAGMVSGDDAGGEDEYADLPLVMAGGGDAGYACLGSRTAPAEGGGARDFDLAILDFQTNDPVSDVCVEVYGNNVVPTEGSCDGSTTGARGSITANDDAGSWFAYRVFPNEAATAAKSAAGTVQVNVEAPAPRTDSVAGFSVSKQTLSLIPTVLGFMRDPGTAVVAGAVFDCMEAPVFGARIRLYDAEGNRIAEGPAQPDPHYRYFDGDSFPDSSQPHTHRDGLYVVANVPVPEAGSAVTVEVWGKRTEDGPAEILGCENTVLFADNVSIVNVGPRRADGPDCPGAR